MKEQSQRHILKYFMSQVIKHMKQNVYMLYKASTKQKTNILYIRTGMP